MFDAKLPRTLISHEAAGDAVLNPSGGEKFVVGADIDVDWSECRYTVPLVDSGGRTRLLKARGVEYTVYTGPTVVPPNASMVFPEMAGPPSNARLFLVTKFFLNLIKIKFLKSIMTNSVFKYNITLA